MEIPAIFFPLILLLVHGHLRVSGFSVLVRGQEVQRLRLLRTQFFFNSQQSGEDGGGGGGGGWGQEDLDNHADQMNPNNDAYTGRDADDYDGDEEDYEYTQDDLDNHADQMNPNNDEYWNSRG